VLSIVRRLYSYLRYKNESDKKLIVAIKAITGSRPLNLQPYKLATQHSSIAKENEKGVKESNERLEYLGDAILGAVVADVLFKKYPYKDEGFLTEIRSRIVNREVMNDVARRIGVNKIVEFNDNKKTSLSHKSIYGDTLEALIGALYLDKGYKPTTRFIINKLLNQQYDLSEITKTSLNYKSKIIEWAQKENRTLRFEIVDEINKKHYKEFVAQLFVDNEKVSNGYGLSKKKAEQAAARKAPATCYRGVAIGAGAMTSSETVTAAVLVIGPRIGRVSKKRSHFSAPRIKRI